MRNLTTKFIIIIIIVTTTVSQATYNISSPPVYRQ